ncbi:hypothetical protein BHE74_00011011 [Ensete ventricosum]|nr:hypothetical protein GW17_00014384 [Ensete ventricosum]RWW80638.1 hypothetical protein BHE74_00011011 [Ensete ventricosum]RZR90028.1 hypothetical protein BHM03_00017848 [Ensete ventricosum]
MAYDRISNFEGVYKSLHLPAVTIGGTFVLIAVVLSTMLILQHLRAYTKPAVRDVNEKLPINHIASILGGEERVVELLENAAREEISEHLLKEEDDEAQHRHSLNDFVFHPTVLGKDLYTIIKFGIVQYVSAYTCMFSMLIVKQLLNSKVCADDTENIMCLLGIVTGAFWSLWRWGIQVVLWV